MTILISLILLINHPLKFLYPIFGNGIAHLADSLDHIFGQYVTDFWVALFFFLIVVFAILAVVTWPGYIHEFKRCSGYLENASDRLPGDWIDYVSTVSAFEYLNLRAFCAFGSAAFLVVEAALPFFFAGGAISLLASASAKAFLFGGIAATNLNCQVNCKCREGSKIEFGKEGRGVSIKRRKM
jgi:hypothetical protein